MKKNSIILRSVFIITLVMTLPGVAYTQADNQNDYRTTYDTASHNKTHTALTSYTTVYDELNNMLNGTAPLNFERAVFITENVYYQNRSNYEDYQRVLDWHTLRILALMAVNDGSDTIDFTAYTDLKERGLDYTSLRYTEEEKRKLYYDALTNWAIFTYLTDTIFYGSEVQLPFGYRADDPFGLNNWGHSQVIHMLSSPERKGNCFAFAALFKIFSDRLNSDAYICTAPQHIYIQHRDMKGHWYNVELPTRTFPDDGTITTLTYTTYEGIMGGLAVRRLEETKQNIVLCLINLGKSYEHRFGSKESDFALRSTELALHYDSLNLNGWLLKHQIFEERVLNYIQENNVTDLTTLQDWEPFQRLEQITLYLYDNGYREMPRYMQEIVLSKLQGDSLPSNVQDRTPNPFTSITVPEQSRRYSTLSGGLFDEIHERKDAEQYGYFVLDTRQRLLIAIDTTYINDPLIDPVVFAWGVDPLASKYPFHSPYMAFANNPILYVDTDGKEFDLSHLSESQRVEYEAKIEQMKSSDIFRYVYEQMEQSSFRFIIVITPEVHAYGTTVGGKFQAAGGGVTGFGVVNFSEHGLSSYVVSQELFHGFQYSNKESLYGDGPSPMSTIETEGDLYSSYVAADLSQAGMSGEWSYDMLFSYDLPPKPSDVLSEDYQNKFQTTVNARIEFYLNDQVETGFTSPTYIADNTGSGPNAINKVFKEVGATQDKLQGPRLPSGDYYSE